MKKVIKNLVSSVLPQIMNIISNLILPGLIIIKFGSDINGLVSTTKTVVSYIGLVGAGIATAVTQALYYPVANEDDSTVKGMLKSANSMFNRYGLIYVIITVAMSFVYPYVIDSNISYWTIAGLLLVMSISGASEFFAIGRCRALLYAHQKVYVCSIIQAISIALSLVLALVMLKLDAGIIVVQFTISFVYVLRGLLLSAYINKMYPQYSDYTKSKPINAAIQKRKDAMVHQLSGLAVTGSQAAILTMIVGLQAASIYSVYNIVLSGLKLICSHLCTAITPFLGKKYALGQNEQLKKMYNVVEFAFFFMVTFVLSVTVVMLIPFVSIYTKQADIDYIFPVFGLLFVLSSAFYILKLPGTAIINVAGHFKETKWRAIVEAFLSVVLGIVFTIIWGKEGVLIGTGCALGWRCVDTIVYSSKRILKESYLRSILRVLLSFVNIMGIKYIFDKITFVPSNYYEWTLMATILSVVVLVILTLEAVIIERKTIKYMLGYFKREKKE